MLALVVDDSRAMRAILTRLLDGLGFDVVQAGDGQEALDVLAGLDEANLPDVALVDWNMPVMDGLTFIKRCRAHAEYRDISLMMVTTESEHARIVRALAAGAHEYVIKPFSEEVIGEKLALLGLVPA
jgi:two-component system chemotaxis response regulator CheY